MTQNPYKYIGPLDLEKDKSVCIPRSKHVRKVIEGITKGEYYAVLGPRQIGKTTFIRQIEKEFPNARYINLNFEVAPESTDNFYKWIIDRFMEEIPHESKTGKWEEWSGDSPEFGFFNFLETFKPTAEQKHIVLLFDEIERIPSVKNFLHVWRKVYQARYRKKQLMNYSVILTGSSDLLKLTVGTNSPFNVAQFYYIKDFSDEEAEALICNPLKELDIQMESKARDKLKSRVSGHPQLLQQACSLLFDTAIRKKRTIIEKDIDRVINELLNISQILDTLNQDVKNHERLRKLIRGVLNGEKKKYLPYKEFSIIGAGAIVAKDDYCAVRNQVYEEYLRVIFENTGEDTWSSYKNEG